VKFPLAAGMLGIGLCAATGASAQSSVTLYGSMDAGVAYINNAGSGPKVIEEQGNTQPDRWGLKGQEDLGNGWYSTFLLENGFSTATGAMSSAGTLWNRQAYVGIGSTQWGTVTLGHQSPFNFDWLGSLSTGYLAQSWYAFHPGNIDELADTSIVPFNNSVKFRSASFGGVTFGAMLGMGDTTDFSYQRDYSFGLSYVQGPIKAAAVYSDEHQATPSLTTVGFSSFQGMAAASYTANDMENMGVGASYQFGKLLVHGLYTRVKLEANGYSDTYQSYDAGANYQLTPANTIAGGGATTTFAGMRWTQFELGDIYSLSKATQLYVNALYEHGDGGAKAAFFTAGVSSNANQVIFLTGIHHSF
jgi:predicted porin